MEAVTVEVKDGIATFTNNMGHPIGVTWIETRNGGRPTYNEATLDHRHPETFHAKPGETLKIVCQHGHQPNPSVEAIVTAPAKVAEPAQAG